MFAAAQRGEPLGTARSVLSHPPWPIREEPSNPAVNPELEHIWDQVRDELRRTVSATTFDIWLAPLRAVSLGDELVLAAPAELQTWVADRHSGVIRQAAGRILRREVGLHITADAPVATPAPRPQPHDRSRAAAPAESPPPRVADPELNPKFTFGQFVIGDANRFAHAAALAVAELPGQAYNPLFIYGPPGVGKTHLLHSIGNYVRTYGDGLTVRYTTVEHFTNDFVASIHAGGGAMERFKDRYRGVDVLLIDDVQFLESKAKTEEEFFHTFNALHDMGAQLVLTSDRVPGDLHALEDRLRERFEAGLVTDIRSPDVATRVAVLRKRVQHDGIHNAGDDVLELLAERIPTNIRALEGGLIRVVAFASLTGRPVDRELTAEVLDGLYAGRQAPPSRVSVADIQELTCEAFAISREELLSESRAARVAWPRQVAMYLAREHTSETLPAIGRQFGGRNHTTVLHAVRRTAERLTADRDAFETVARIADRLRADHDRRD
jgi:chromosomal replication initiator protein